MNKADWEEWLSYPTTQAYFRSLRELRVSEREKVQSGRTLFGPDGFAKTALEIGIGIGIQHAVDHEPAWAEHSEE